MKLDKNWLDDNTKFVAEIDDLLEEVNRFNSRALLNTEEVVELCWQPNQYLIRLTGSRQYLTEDGDWKSEEVWANFDRRAQRTLERGPTVRPENFCWNCFCADDELGAMEMCLDCWNLGPVICDGTGSQPLDEEDVNSINLCYASEGFEIPASVEVDGIVYHPYSYKLRMCMVK